MIGSTLTALAANPSLSVVCLLSSVFCNPSSVIRHLLSIVLLFVPLRFAIIFYSKILFIESTPTPPCSQIYRHPFFEPSPQRGEGRVRGVVDPFV